MKIRAQAKILNGKTRWYVVSSYRDERTGRPRTRHHLYLGLEPNKEIRDRITRINESSAQYKHPRYLGKEFEKIRKLAFKQRNQAKIERKRLRGRFKRGPADETVPPLDPFESLMARACRLKQDYLRCVDEVPLEEHPPEQLCEFLRDTQWLVDAREKAEKSLRR
jgi:hypothetical protein